MANFNSLKKTSADISRLTKEIEKLNSNTGEKTEDNRFWQPEADKAGNGMAVIRFLPAPAVDGDDALPWARIFTHGFKGPTGKWYIENSLTTLNQKDPVTDYNSVLWNASEDDASPQRKQARAQKRKLVYISNIMVISDPKNPESEGKIFLFRYGKKIFDKITQSMNPEFEGDDPVNPFDFWTGANFKLRIRQVEGYRNYDMSQFESPSVLSSDDDKLKAIWEKEYSLKEFTDPKNFKSYDELKKRLNEVLELDGGSAAAPAPTKAMKPKAEEDDDLPWNDPPKKQLNNKAAAKKQESSSEEDEDLDYYKALLDEE